MPKITPEMIEAGKAAYLECHKESNDCYVDVWVSAILSAALSAQPVVKPLLWKASPLSDSLVAAHPFGENYVIQNCGHYFRTVGQDFPTMEEAKAAAQADYDARILSALTTPPAPAASEPVALDEIASLIPDEVELPPMTDRGTAGQVLDAAWPIAGGNHQPYEFWYAVAFGAQLALKMFPPAPTGDGWRPIETAPKNTKVLAAYQNELGNWRIVTACYHTQLEWSDEYGDHEEEFAPEAWYEENDSSEVIYPTSRVPTHWQPLPAAPTPPKEGGR